MDARIRIILRIIDERGGTLAISAKEIGSLLGLGEARIRRLFSYEVGKTLCRHMLEVRMARAERMLMNAVTPIKTIAFDCGYTVVSNFYRDFKRMHGLGPREMRRRYLSEQLRDDRSRSGYLGGLSNLRIAEIAGSVDSPAGTIDRQTAA